MDYLTGFLAGLAYTHEVIRKRSHSFQSHPISREGLRLIYLDIGNEITRTRAALTEKSRGR